MSKSRVTATDRLANVIEVVELGQRTGLLSAERGSGSVLEEGEIYFVSGRVIYAALAGLRGREALAALSRWGPCRFAFDRDVAPPAPNIMSQSGPYDRPSEPRTPPHPSMDSQPSGYFPQRGASSGVWPISPQSPLPGTNGSPSQSFPLSYSQPHTSGYLGPQSGYLGSSRSIVPGANGVRTPPDLASGDTRELQRRPRRAPDVRDLMSVVTTYNLSRSHRTILLLADGEHTVLDLARLSSKSIEEITLLLNELEARGLIYYYT